MHRYPNAASEILEKKKVGKQHEDHGSLTRDSQGLAGKGR